MSNIFSRSRKNRHKKNRSNRSVCSEIQLTDKIYRSSSGGISCIATWASNSTNTTIHCAAGTKQGTILIVSDDSDVTIFKAHDTLITSLVIYPGNIIVSGSFDHTIKIWSLNIDDVYAPTVITCKKHVVCLAPYVNNKLVAAVGNEILIINIQSAKTINVISNTPEQTSNITCMAVNHDTVIYGTHNGMIIAFNIYTQQCTHFAHVYRNETVSCIAILDNNKYAYGNSSGNRELLMGIRDVQYHTLLREIVGNPLCIINGGGNIMMYVDDALDNKLTRFNLQENTYDISYNHAKMKTLNCVGITSSGALLLGDNKKVVHPLHYKWKPA